MTDKEGWQKFINKRWPDGMIVDLQIGDIERQMALPALRVLRVDDEGVMVLVVDPETGKDWSPHFSEDSLQGPTPTSTDSEFKIHDTIDPEIAADLARLPQE